MLLEAQAKREVFMTEKLVDRVSFRDSDHSYTLAGKKLPSVTTILGNLSKPALPWWAAKVGAQAVESRVLDLDLAVISDWKPSDVEAFATELFDLAQRAHIDIRNKAGKKGTAVHAAIDAYHTDFFTAAPPAEPDEQAAWTAFLEWWNTSGLTAVDTERKIVDSEGRYAGRLDLLAADNAGNMYVCDIKTSNRVYTEAIMQNAAYAHAIESEGDYTIRGTKVLHLPAGCTTITIVERDREEWLLDYRMFDGLVALHAYRKGMDAWVRTINDNTNQTKDEA